jgi:phospholipid/cholesterol/gamma-HCH transport system substrate-binding protein
MQQRSLELAVGGFVAVGLFALFMLAMKVSNLGGVDAASSYELTARFDNIGGLKPQAPVTLAGVTVGRVMQIVVDKETHEAIVSLTVDETYDNLSEDTSARIQTAGLLGEQYIGLTPGGAPDMLKDGDEIKLTQSALVWENLVSEFLYQKTVASDSDKAK